MAGKVVEDHEIRFRAQRVGENIWLTFRDGVFKTIPTADFVALVGRDLDVGESAYFTAKLTLRVITKEAKRMKIDNPP